MRALVLALAILLAGWPAPAMGNETKTVVVDGAGVTEEAARRDALRNAVEKAAGVLVMAESQTRDYELVKDRIRTVADAFVTDQEVLATGRSADGVVQVQMRVTVTLGTIKDSLQALAILQARKHNPSFAVISESKGGTRGDDEATAAAVGAVHAYLQERLLNLVDAKTVEALRTDDALIQQAQGHQLSVAQEVANRLKADVYVTVYGHVERSASVNVRFFESSTGRLLGEESGYSPAVTYDLARQKLAVAGATREATDKAFASLLNYWRRDTSQGSQLTVVASGLNFARKTKFRKLLQAVARDVKQLNATAGHAEFLIWTDDSPEDTVEAIYEAAVREKLGISAKFDPHARGSRVIFTFEEK